MKTLPIVTVVAALTALGLSGCGSSSDDGGSDSGLDVPSATLTDADLAPGTLKALDAAVLKSKMESGGEGSYKDNTPDDPEDDPNSCFNKLLAGLKIEAKDDTLRLNADLDFSDCYVGFFKAEDAYKDADFTAFKVAMTSHFATWIQCEGQDLAAYDGKAFTEVKTVPECNKAETVKVWSESSSTTKISGEIKNAKSEGTTFTYAHTEDSFERSAQRTASGDSCTATLVAGVYTYDDDCIWTSRELASAKKTGVKGSEEVDADVGKETYEQLKSVGLKQAADDTTLWYVGGQFAVVYNDWAGTVKYSSGTAEPIFEMKKGTETQTGTIKAKEPAGLVSFAKLLGN